jgi:DNA-binding response OmpR family regulator
MTEPRIPPEILVVDDEPDLRHICARVLEQHDWPSDCMRTAREAIYAMEAHPARLVLMDVNLDPDDAYPNGCEAALAIVRRWPNTRVMLITGWTAFTLPEDCEGMPLLTKPFGGDELASRVRHVLSEPPWRTR